MEIKNVIVVYADPMNLEQKSCISHVENVLKKNHIGFESSSRYFLSKTKFSGKDLVVAVGGDGTFLRSSHFTSKQPILGVNADPKNKEGFFMKSTKINFEKKLKEISEETAKIVELPRLEAAIGGKKIGTLALNEFYVGQQKSYHAAKYVISALGKLERQKSSGVLVVTPAGSYAWLKAFRKNILPLGSKDFQFAVREPYEWKVFNNYELKYGVLHRGQKIRIDSEMLDCILVADSVSKEYPVKFKEKVEIGMSSKSLKAVWDK